MTPKEYVEVVTVEDDLRWVRANSTTWKQYVCLMDFCFRHPGSKIDLEQLTWSS